MPSAVGEKCVHVILLSLLVTHVFGQGKPPIFHFEVTLFYPYHSVCANYEKCGADLYAARCGNRPLAFVLRGGGWLNDDRAAFNENQFAVSTA